MKRCITVIMKFAREGRGPRRAGESRERSLAWLLWNGWGTEWGWGGFPHAGWLRLARFEPLSQASKVRAPRLS